MSTKFRPDIEGLRAIAIILVVAFHCGIPGFSGGFVGVDVFFVVSGYLITGLLLDERERHGRIDLPGFYARRARRLLPAAVLMVLVTAVIGRFVYSPLEQIQYDGTAKAAGLYLSNAWFARSASSYLGGDTDLNPLLHTWSLAVEEQFYIVWPSVIIMLTRSPARRARTLLIGMAGVFAVSLALCVGLTRFVQPWAFYGSPARAWEFALGAIALLLSRHLRPGRTTTMGIAVSGLGAIGAASLLFDRATVFPGYTAVLPAAGTAAVLFAGTYGPDRGILRPLATAPMQTLGKLSYSWYLWHWPALVLGAVMLGTLNQPERLAAVGVGLFVAALSYKLVENPVRFSPRLVRNVRASLSLGLLLTFLAGAASWGLQSMARGSANLPEQRRFAAAHDDLPVLYSDGCHLNFLEVQGPRCAFGDTASAQTAVLFGDSHAAQWFPALLHIAIDRHWRLVTMTKSGCPPIGIPIELKQLKRDYTECLEWRSLVMNRIRRLSPALVVMSSFSHYAVSPATLAGATRQSLATLNGWGIPTVFIEDTPRSSVDVPTCLSRAAWTGTSASRCSTTRADAIDSAVERGDSEAADGLQWVRLVDMADEICGPSECPAVQKGLVVYRDADHLTASFVATLAPTLGKALADAPRASDRLAER